MFTSGYISIKSAILCVWMESQVDFSNWYMEINYTISMHLAGHSKYSSQLALIFQSGLVESKKVKAESNSQPCWASDYSLLLCRRNRKEEERDPIGGIQLVAS